MPVKDGRQLTITISNSSCNHKAPPHSPGEGFLPCKRPSAERGVRLAYYLFYRAESTVNGPQTHRTTQSMVRGAVLQEAIDYDRPETEQETEIQNP